VYFARSKHVGSVEYFAKGADPTTLLLGVMAVMVVMVIVIADAAWRRGVVPGSELVELAGCPGDELFQLAPI
jgi:hypothetical protein